MCVQVVREMRCDMHAAASYASAYQLFAAGTASKDATQDGTLSDVWKYSPLDDTCVLFARKFLPDTNKELDTFFNDCDQIGLGSHCLMHAAHGRPLVGVPPSSGHDAEFMHSEASNDVLPD